MSFFQGSSDVTIDGSYISEIGGDFNINLMTQEPVAFLAQLLGKRKACDSSDFDAADGLRKRQRCSTNSDGLKIVKTDEFELRTELISRSNYRIHSASYGAQGRVLAVKLFEGPQAKQDWTKNVTFLKKSLHSNTPKIVGVSDESSEVPFVVFHGISEKKLQSLIAKALRTDLNKSVELSMKAVKGLAAGLNYIRSQKISGALTDVRGWESFDIFAGDNGEPIIAIHVPSTSHEDSSASPSSAIQSDDHGIEALNGLCQKLFSEVNSVLYDDSPQRELDGYDEESLPTSSIEEVSEGAESISECVSTPTTPPSNSTKQLKLNRPPRREVQWRLGMGASNRNLDSIARRFGDYLDCFLSSSSDPPLRRIKASKEAYSRLQTSHQCPGYLREEITLTTDVARSAIIFHEYPSQSEVCSVCGQLVQYQVPELDLQPQPDLQTQPDLPSQSDSQPPPHTSSQAPQLVLTDYEIMQIPYREFLRLQTLLGLDDKHLGNMSINEKTSILHAFQSSPMTVPMRAPQIRPDGTSFYNTPYLGTFSTPYGPHGGETYSPYTTYSSDSPFFPPFSSTQTMGPPVSQRSHVSPPLYPFSAPPPLPPLPERWPFPPSVSSGDADEEESELPAQDLVAPWEVLRGLADAAIQRAAKDSGYSADISSEVSDHEDRPARGIMARKVLREVDTQRAARFNPESHPRPAKRRKMRNS